MEKRELYELSVHTVNPSLMSDIEVFELVDQSVASEVFESAEQSINSEVAETSISPVASLSCEIIRTDSEPSHSSISSDLSTTIAVHGSHTITDPTNQSITDKTTFEPSSTQCGCFSVVCSTQCCQVPCQSSLPPPELPEIQSKVEKPNLNLIPDGIHPEIPVCELCENHDFSIWWKKLRTKRILKNKYPEQFRDLKLDDYESYDAVGVKLLDKLGPAKCACHLQGPDEWSDSESLDESEAAEFADLIAIVKSCGYIAASAPVTEFAPDPSDSEVTEVTEDEYFPRLD